MQTLIFQASAVSEQLAFTVHLTYLSINWKSCSTGVSEKKIQHSLSFISLANSVIPPNLPSKILCEKIIGLCSVSVEVK